MKPGTYRIVNLKSDTAITENHLGTVGWRISDSKNQQWFLQRSGEGYRFKNVASGGYLAVAIKEKLNNRLYCSGYPTTWALVPNHEHGEYGHYGIVMGDTDRILDLLGWGSAADGTEIHASVRAWHTGSTQHMAWKFEYIHDDTGEEESSNLAQIQDALSRAENTIQTQATEIEFLRRLVLDGRQEVIRAPNPQQRPNNMP